MTSFDDMVYQFGGMPVMAGLPFSGSAKYFFLDPTNGSDSYEGTTPARAKKTLPAAYALLTSGQHDTLFYISGTSSISLAAEFVWAHSYTHFIGICAPTGIGQRARIFQTAATTNLTPLITVSGSGNIFKNFYVFQGLDDAGSLVCFQVTGGRNYFENVHFAGAGHTTNAIDGAASLNLNGSAAENRFVRCTIGIDTVAAATGVTGLLLDGGTATVHTTRNEFYECTFRQKAAATTTSFIELMQITAIDRDTVFERCRFVNLGASTIANAVICPAGFDPGDKRLLFYDCTLLGGVWDANDRGIVFGNMGTPTGVDASGVLLALEG
jgi:hypothetical protein